MSDGDGGCDADEKPKTAQVLADGGRSTLGRILSALANKRNRYVAYYLAENEPADIEACAAAVAAWEQGTTPTAISADARRRIETVLYHQHLPKLADLGIIEYDQRSGAICFQHPPPHFEEFLALARTIEMGDAETD